MKLLIAVPCLFLILLSLLFQTNPRFVPLAPIDASTALVVNMIPPELSDEHGQNSDPFLAVSHGAALIIGAANYPAAAQKKPPLFQSADYGRNWRVLSSVLPVKTVENQTYCFAGNGTNFYGAITGSTEAGRTFLVVRGTDLSGDKPLEIISTSSVIGDQPFLQARKSDAGDSIYIGELYLGSKPDVSLATAAVRVLTPGQTEFTIVPVEARPLPASGQDAPAVRPALAANDDTVYVAFIRWQSIDGPETGGEIVVVRDDGDAATKSFRSLIDPGDRKTGRLVATNQTFQLNKSLGQQKIGPNLAMAVHPQNKEIVYLCWGSYDTEQKIYQLHLRVSLNGGQNWSNTSLPPIPSAVNPALAVAEDGSAGFLYQQLVADPKGEVWETHFRQQDAGSAVWSDLRLSSFPTAVEPKKEKTDGDPYLAYRLNLIASDGVFYGAFSAPNIPEPQYFPQGVRFQRKYANGKLFSNNEKEVPFSIDPYFFSVSKPRTGPASSAGTPSPPQAPVVSKWATNISTWALPIVTLLLIGALLWFARRQPKKWESALQEQLKVHGPALLNFDGYLTGHFMDNSGNIIDKMRQDSSCVLRVEVTNQKPSEPWHELIDLTGGLDAPQVEFRIVIDSSQLQVEPTIGVITVPVKGRSERDFAVKPKPNKADNSRVFVQLFQRTSLIQVMELQLLIIE
jgi:hypothetical protein